TAMLESLRRSNNHRIAIATGCWRASAKLKLRSARFDTQGIPLATSDDHHDRSRIMLKALSELGAEFESITYYGDGAWDRDACRTLGWAFVPVGPAMNGLESYHTVRFS
ncbi:MAG: HAD family hydrolase, partial [Woeseiaceae bacterium]